MPHVDGRRALQLSVAVTNAMTLASEGGFAGLQPRFEPVGTVTVGGGGVGRPGVNHRLGAETLPQPSVAVTVKVRVTVQPLVASACVTLTVAVPQLSVAVTCALTLASVGGLAGLQPKLPPAGMLAITGAVVSTKVMC